MRLLIGKVEVILIGIGKAIGDVVGNIVASIVMLVVAILSFCVTVFVISTGAQLAGYEPVGDFIVLSATILASAAIVSGMWKEG
jgi:hypothetical protein